MAVFVPIPQTKEPDDVTYVDEACSCVKRFTPSGSSRRLVLKWMSTSETSSLKATSHASLKTKQRGVDVFVDRCL